MRRAIDYLTVEEIKALRQAAASLAKELKCLKKDPADRKQTKGFGVHSRTART